MTANLSQKERTLLQDQLSHEKVCIQKYQNYANQTQDQQLKQLFHTYAQQEQQHYNTIRQILDGQVPATTQSQAGQAGQNRQSSVLSNTQAGQQAGAPAMTGPASDDKQKDAAICNDMLMTEKYVSGSYDTAIFEFAHAGIRQALNHIQKEEQQHGEGIFNYMQSQGMYNLQA